MLPDHPRVIGGLRLSGAVIVAVGMPGMVVRVSMSSGVVLAQIAVRVVRDRIAPAAANHTRLVGAPLIDALSLP